MENTPFHNSPLITGPNLKQKWNRLTKDTDRKSSLTREGANLSGLAEPPDLEKLVIPVMETKAQQKEDKDAKTKKEKECQDKILTHEATIMQFQDIAQTPIKSCLDDKVEDLTSHNSSVSSTTGSSTDVFENSVLNALRGKKKI